MGRMAKRKAARPKVAAYAQYWKLRTAEPSDVAFQWQSGWQRCARTVMNIVAGEG